MLVVFVCITALCPCGKVQPLWLQLCVCVSYRAGYRERQSTVWVWVIENKIKNGWNNESRWVMQCVRLIFPRSRMSQAVPVLFSSFKIIKFTIGLRQWKCLFACLPVLGNTPFYPEGVYFPPLCASICVITKTNRRGPPHDSPPSLLGRTARSALLV